MKTKSARGAAREWELCYRKLREFRDKHGHLRISPSAPDFRLFVGWILAQRTRHSQLAQEQVEKLLAIGFLFGPHEHHWYKRFFDLRDFIGSHGRFPKSTDKSAEEESLYSWVLNQRKRRKKDALDLQRIQWLDALGIQWQKQERRPEAFSRHFEELKAFKEKHGHCRVPVHFPENFALGHWITVVRGSKRRLDDEQIRQLDELDFDWNPQQSTWESSYKELAGYVEQNGHFPRRWTGHHRLSDWVRTQRKRRKTLALEQRKKLDVLGFPWNPRDERWNREYFGLVKFRERFGHCRVPADEPEFHKLYKWLYFQKSQRAHIPDDHRERLEKLGVEWTIQHPATTRERMRQLEGFFAKHGHCNVTKTDDSGLAQWLSSIRRRRESLSASMKNRLQAMAINWSPLQSSAEKRMNELSAFRRKYGHCRVPVEWPENPDLGHWVQAQKSLHRKSRLSAKRKQRLDDLGFDWGNWEKTRWEENYRNLTAFRDEFGHCLVPDSHNEALAGWVYRQRSNRNQLSHEQVRQLDEIDFIWKPKDPTRGG